MNKNKIWKPLTMVLLTFFLAGCAKEVRVLPPLDKKTAEEESAVLIIPANASVERIDGKKRGFMRSWGTGGYAFSGPKAATMLVPAGEHTIKFDSARQMEGWAARNLEYVIVMEAGKMYILSVEMEQKTGNAFLSLLVASASFTRDLLIDNFLPFSDSLPHSKSNAVYRINEIDQAGFDQWLLDEGNYRKKTSFGYILLILLVCIVWIIISFLALPMLWSSVFMKRFKDNHGCLTIIISLVVILASLILINYNSNGSLSLYLAATVIFSFGIAIFLGGKKTDNSGDKEKEEATGSGGAESLKIEK
jgi:hypothetical protein